MINYFRCFEIQRPRRSHHRNLRSGAKLIFFRNLPIKLIGKEFRNIKIAY